MPPLTLISGGVALTGAGSFGAVHTAETPSKSDDWLTMPAMLLAAPAGVVVTAVGMAKEMSAAGVRVSPPVMMSAWLGLTVASIGAAAIGSWLGESTADRGESPAAARRLRVDG